MEATMSTKYSWKKKFKNTFRIKYQGLGKRLWTYQIIGMSGNVIFETQDRRIKGAKHDIYRYWKKILHVGSQSLYNPPILISLRTPSKSGGDL